jgi:translation initiation factor IF-2
MSKMRIYELAKELGVENKVVIQKAQELGIRGKISHSHSLDSDEVDKIRRMVVRRAVDENAEQAQGREVITQRVDKATGTAEAVVERRSGNVIRRRKATADGVVTSSVVSAAPSSAGHAPDSSVPSLPTEVEASTAIDSAPAQAALEVANELFKAAEETSNAEALPGVPEAAEEAELVASEPSPVIPEAASAPSNHDVVEQVAPVPTEVAQAVPPKAPELPKKPGVGPRVLGRIELPVAVPRRTVATLRPEMRRGPAGSAATAVAPLVRVMVDDEDELENAKKSAAKRKGRKREISRVDLIDYEGREGRRLRPGGKSSKKLDADARALLDQTRPKASKRVVRMAESITVGEIARQMSVKAGELIAKLIELGVMATINQVIDFDTASVLASEFDFQIESTTFDESEMTHEKGMDAAELLQPRPPVVTVMGHVDHGKTSLLDMIRKTSVASREHGGITQHIGAYRVVTAGGKAIAFLDTPGHAAFTSMRARGAKVTDIVVLVVAADDGVMPQTVEAINHAKAAGVSIIVAVNKIDKPGATPDRVKNQLVEHGLQPEEWGGSTMFVPVSALQGTGIPDLLERILLQADVMELKANPDRRAIGTIIESRQDKGRGTVATVLVKSGTLRVGDIFVCGSESGRVRAMNDENGERLLEAGPSTPVEVMGLSGVPLAGDDFIVVEDEANAREVASNRAAIRKVKEQRALATGPISLEEFSRRANNLAAQELNVILKADVHGSLEAVSDALEKLSTEKVKVRVIHAAVGGVSESDIQLAIASKAVVVGFGVRAEARTMEEAERSGIDIRFYRIIYELLDDIKKAMAGLLAPIRTEVVLGRVQVREIFNVGKIGTVAGCFVSDGLVRRTSRVRVLRDSRVVHEGGLASLRRFKDDAREVASGYECGIALEGFNDVKVGDVLEAYEVKETAATID